MSDPTPHVSFSAEIAASDAFPHPLGYELAQSLRAVLQGCGVEGADSENWRDCGWSIAVRVDGRAFEIYFAQAQPPNWLLAIAPRSDTSLLGSLFGRESTDCLKWLRALSEMVHQHVTSLAPRSDIHWQFNAEPTDKASVSEPSNLDWSRGH